jgi:uncharacterized membrane protein YadS
LITGALTGIGRATALAFANEGAQIVVSGRHDDAGAALVAPLKDLRSWAFIFCFFSIGLTTRFREFAGVGSKPFLGFTAGVVVNVILGFLLSAVVFASYWKGVLGAPL